MSDLPRKGQMPLLMACAAHPLAVLAMALLAPAAVGRVWILAVAQALLAVVCLAVPGRRRLAAGLAGCALIVALGLASLPWRAFPASLLVCAVYAAVLLTGLPIAAWPQHRELRAGWSIAGVAGHVVALTGIGMTLDGRISSPLPPAAPALSVTFVLLLALAMLSMNRANLLTATMGKQRVPARMRRRNALMSVVFLALALLIAAMPSVARAVEAVWSLLVNAVKALVAWLLALVPVPTEAPSGGGAAAPMDVMGMMEEIPEPSAFVLLLERILSVAALVALAALILLGLRVVYRRLKGLLRVLLDRLGRFAASAAEDYVDEITDTREEPGAENLPRRGLFRRHFGGSDRQLAPRERIRRRYLRLRWKHAEWQPSRSARETLPGDAATLYERARYSGHEITEEDAATFAESVKSM